MKNTFLILLLFCSYAIVSAQWTTSNPNIYNNPLSYNVGIGTAAPTAKLHVMGTLMRVTNNAGYIDMSPQLGSIEIGSEVFPFAYIDLKGQQGLNTDFGGRIIYLHGSGLSFQTNNNGASRMTITDAGFVGVNTMNPVATFQVEGSSRFSFGNYNIQVLPNGGGIEILAPTSLSFIDFKTYPYVGDYQGRIVYDNANGFKIHTNANSSPRVYVTNSGAVGIGITPVTGMLLHTYGKARFQEGTTGMIDIAPSLRAFEIMGSNSNQYIDFKSYANNSYDYEGRILHNTSTGFSFYTANSPIAKMNIQNTGKVVIGDPSEIFTGTANEYLLYVQTGILTEKVKIAIHTTTDWSDYVFAPDYDLKDLD